MANRFTGPIFSPREKRVRQCAASRRWQKRNPEKVRAYRKHRWRTDRTRMAEQNRQWYLRHPKVRSINSRRAVRELRPYYLRTLLRGRGVLNPTPEDFEEQRQRALARRRHRAALRAHQTLRMVAVCARPTKPAKSPTS